MKIDFKQMKKIIYEKYDCDLINIFNYKNHDYAKVLKVEGKDFFYRYFEIINNDIREVKDKLLLEELKNRNEIVSNVIY